MRKFVLLCAIAALACCALIVRGQTPATTTASQDRLVGEVTAIDVAGQITIKTDAGQTVAVAVDEQTSYLRILPGETTLDRAAKITRADVAVGDRVLVRGVAAMKDAGLPARQVIVMSKASVATEQEGRRRWLAGRITALNAERQEITVTARSREGAEQLTITASGNVKLLRYAPDSLRPTDARPGSFGELKVGDQLRARGERSSDSTRFTPEEIITGSITRVGGTVTEVDAARNEIKLKDEQTGNTQIITVGKNSMLRRIPPDVAETLTQRRGERRARGEGRRGEEGAARREERAGEGGAQRRGRNLQQVLENLPAITVADLKKGDAVIITGTTHDDAARLTAITLFTGEAEFIKRWQRSQTQRGGQRSMSPGLPGDVLGGGAGNREP